MAPRKPRRSDKVRRFFITPRESREAEERFRRDMGELRAALRAGRHPKESVDQFADRLLTALEEVLTRHKRMSWGIRVPVPTGRPPKLFLEPGIIGRPPDPLAMRVATTAQDGQRRVADVARAMFAENLRTERPERYTALMRVRQSFEEQGYTPDRALRRALGHPRFTAEHEDVDRLIRNSRNHLKPRR